MQNVPNRRSVLFFFSFVLLFCVLILWCFEGHVPNIPQRVDGHETKQQLAGNWLIVSTQRTQLEQPIETAMLSQGIVNDHRRHTDII